MPGPRLILVDPSADAGQMAAASRWYLHPPGVLDWAHAQDRQDRVRRGGDLGLALREGPPG